MPLYRIQASLQDISGLARDRYVNTIYVLDDAQLLDQTAAVAAMQAFYTTIGTAGYFSPQVIGTLSTINLYAMAAARPRPPLRSVQFAVPGSPGATPLPAEVAMVMTYHADPVPLPVKPQSWRGRIYIGPLSTNCIASPPSGADLGSRPKGAFIANVLASGVALAAAIDAAGGKLVIVSYKQKMSYPVASISVDDAWDTQRSRGDRATAVQKVVIPAGGGAGTAMTPAEYAEGNQG